MMTSQILRSEDFTKSQKPRYLENETSFSIQIKKLIKGATKSYRKIIFVSATKIGENTSNILNCYF